MDELMAFVHARLDEEEWWASEASRRDTHSHTSSGEHWRWECEATDQPVVLDPALDEYLVGQDGASVGLRSVEEYESSVGPISHLVIHNQQEIQTTVAGHIVRHDPARTIRDVEAKRRIVEQCERDLRTYVGTGAQAATPYLVLRLLALPYADHPDYQEAWKP